MLATLDIPQVSAEEPPDLDSREIKVLLRPDAFEDADDFFEKSLNLIRNLAAEKKVRFHEPVEAKVKTREIRYFDTEDFALRAKGWTLRQRLKTRGERRADHAELAIKFRSSDRGAVMNADISVDPKYTSKDEFEEDIHPVEVDGPWRSSYARRSKIENLPVFESPSIADVASIFPSLAEHGLDSELQLVSVGGPFIEKRMQPGYLDFGGAVLADVEITWLENAAGEAIVGEISYDYSFTEKKSSVASIWASLQFLPSLRLALGEAWQPGSGKTSFIFERAGYQNP
jgi:hypothetical protein